MDSAKIFDVTFLQIEGLIATSSKMLLMRRASPNASQRP
jgi:hypothetical protein